MVTEVTKVTKLALDNTFVTSAPFVTVFRTIKYIFTENYYVEPKTKHYAEFQSFGIRARLNRRENGGGWHTQQRSVLP